jgi:hypothetical protein
MQQYLKAIGKWFKKALQVEKCSLILAKLMYLQK